MAREGAEWFVYMLRCGAGGTLYVGRTTDVNRRFEEHRSGKGARYTRAHPPTAIEWFEGGHDSGSSARREAQVKRMRRSAKLALILERPAAAIHPATVSPGSRR